MYFDPRGLIFSIQTTSSSPFTLHPPPFTLHHNHSLSFQCSPSAEDKIAVRCINPRRNTKRWEWKRETNNDMDDRIVHAQAESGTCFSAGRHTYHRHMPSELPTDSKIDSESPTDKITISIGAMRQRLNTAYQLDKWRTANIEASNAEKNQRHVAVSLLG